MHFVRLTGLPTLREIARDENEAHLLGVDRRDHAFHAPALKRLILLRPAGDMPTGKQRKAQRIGRPAGRDYPKTRNKRHPSAGNHDHDDRA